MWIRCRNPGYLPARECEASVYTDDELAELSPSERDDLIRKLNRLVDDVSLTHGRSSQERFVGLFAVATILLIGWTAYLSRTLPRTYTAGHWRATWVGFDIALAVVLAATALLAALRIQLVILTSAAGGTMLAFDAWFDTMTAKAGDRWLSIATVPVELGGAIFLLGTAATLLHSVSPGTAPGSRQRGLLAPLPGMRAGGLRPTLAAFKRMGGDGASSS